MTKKEAIAALENLLGKINKDFRGDAAWTDALFSVLGQIYGYDSQECSDRSYFSAPKDTDYLCRKIQAYIANIQLIGIPNEEKYPGVLPVQPKKSNNIFTRLNTWESWGVLIVLVLAFGSMSFYFGGLSKQLDMVNIKDENKELKDSLRTLRALYEKTQNEANRKAGERDHQYTDSNLKHAIHKNSK